MGWFVSRFFRFDRPRILLLVDKQGWVFDYVAHEIKKLFIDKYIIDIRYVRNTPNIDPKDYDLLYVFFWGENSHMKYGFDPHCIIKEVSSYRWMDDPRYGPCTAEEFREKYLRETQSITCTSLRMINLINGYHPSIYHSPNGFDPEQIYYYRNRTGKLTIGWAGNSEDPVKQYKTVLQPACVNRFTLLTAPGNVPRKSMNHFYNKLDVIALCSKHEGQALPIIEAMAAGCFPVCSNVGIVPEFINSGENGIVVEEATMEAFADAFDWCEKNLDKVREAGKINACLMLAERPWNKLRSHYEIIFSEALHIARKPRWRNDDLTCDCPFDYFKKFCNIFWKYGYTQIHGVTLFGKTIARNWGSGKPSQYEGELEISSLSNNRILELSEPYRFDNRADLIEFLNNSPDEIALHGLYHVNYSEMPPHEQRQHISEGLVLLKKIFPQKTVRYFIPPFNKVNDSLYQVCHEFSLTVSADEGIHLESVLDNLQFIDKSCYRYHHHRFYPDSTFDYYMLDLDKLEKIFSFNLQ